VGHFHDIAIDREAAGELCCGECLEVSRPGQPDVQRLEPLGGPEQQRGSGRSSVASDNRLSTANPTRNRSGTASGAQPERGLQRIALRVRETVEATEHRHAELMQPGERQLLPRLDADRAHDPKIRRRFDRVPQQRGLPDPGLPRTTSAPLRPARTASSSRSKTSHSLWRPRNIEAGRRSAMSVVQS
jgi:hypothetical protein